MSTDLPTRATVEAAPNGRLSISFVYVAQCWEEEERMSRLLDAIVTTINEVQEAVPFWIITRLVVVTSDFPSEVIRWQRELGEQEGVTSGIYGEAHGKALVWGNNTLEATYGVVILSELIALCLIEGIAQNQALAKAVLTHELAHVHDEFIYRQVFGQPFPNETNNWAELRRTLAYVTWSEFFANFVAYHFHKVWGCNDEIFAPTSLIKRISLEISRRIFLYRFDGNMQTLWFSSVSDLLQVFAQSARSLGLLVAAQMDSDDKSEELFALCDEISPSWGNIMRRLTEELGRQPRGLQRSPGLLDQIGLIIERGFHAVGLYPSDPEAMDAEKGIWVDVP